MSVSRLGVADQRAFVVEEDELAAVGYAVEALRGLPGVALANAGSRGALTQLRVRGAEANHLLVLVDGVPVNDPAAGSAFNFGLLDLAGIRRVEFAAGPRSAIWGAEALAGVLYLETTPQRPGGSLALAVGSNDTVDADLQLRRFGRRGHAALAVGSMASAGTNAAREGGEADGFANRTANLHLGAEVGNWSLAASHRWTDALADFDPTPPPRYVPQDGDRRTEDRQGLLLASARYLGHEHVTPWLTLASQRTAMRHLANGAVGNTYAGRRDTVRAAVNVVWDERRAGHGVNLVVDAEREGFAQTGAPSPFGDPNQRQRMTTLGFGGEYQRRSRRLVFSVSARHDWNDAFRDALAWRLGVSSLGRLRLFASVGRGVANPTFVERFGHAPDTFLGNPRLRPEQGRSLEAGVERRWQRGSLAAVAFDTQLRDEIDGFAFAAEHGAFTARNRPGKSSRRGAELRFAAASARLRVRGSYTYVDATTGDGGRELRRPRHLASLALRAQLASGWSWGLALAHAGSSADLDFGATPAREVILGGFRLLRADLGYAPAPKWRLRLILDNVLDADATTIHGYASPGRSALVRAELRL